MGSDESKKNILFLGNLRWFIYNFGLFLLSKLVYWNKISQCKCLKVLKLTLIWRYKSCSTKHLAFAGTHIFRSFTVLCTIRFCVREKLFWCIFFVKICVYVELIYFVYPELWKWFLKWEIGHSVWLFTIYSSFSLILWIVSCFLLKIFWKYLLFFFFSRN